MADKISQTVTLKKICWNRLAFTFHAFKRGSKRQHCQLDNLYWEIQYTHIARYFRGTVVRCICGKPTERIRTKRPQFFRTWRPPEFIVLYILGLLRNFVQEKREWNEVSDKNSSRWLVGSTGNKLNHSGIKRFHRSSSYAFWHPYLPNHQQRTRTSVQDRLFIKMFHLQASKDHGVPQENEWIF